MKGRKRIPVTVCCLFLTTLPTTQIEKGLGMTPLQNFENESRWGSTNTFRKQLFRRPRFRNENQTLQTQSNESKAEQSTVQNIRSKQAPKALENRSHASLHSAQPIAISKSISSRDEGLLDGEHANDPKANRIQTKNVIQESVQPLQQQIKTIALSYLGASYRWGGTNPDSGFDCSGYTQYVFRKAGIILPRTTFEQFQKGVFVHGKNLMPGDLLFYSTYAKGPSHVGIYLGNGSFIHSLNANTGVVVSRIDDPYYASRLVGVKRIERP